MLHCIKYELLNLLRNKVVVFWLLGFPIILGTLFFAAFGSLADSEQDYKNMPVAVIEKGEAPMGFDSLINTLSAGKDALFSIKTRDEATAKELMEKGELDGIIYSDKEISLEVPGDAGIKSGIIKSVLDSFTSRYDIISSVAEKDPEKLPELLENIDAETSFIKSSSNEANSDPYVQYFYNLLAMAGLLGSIGGRQSSSKSFLIGRKGGGKPHEQDKGHFILSDRYVASAQYLYQHRCGVSCVRSANPIWRAVLGNCLS